MNTKKHVLLFFSVMVLANGLAFKALASGSESGGGASAAAEDTKSDEKNEKREEMRRRMRAKKTNKCDESCVEGENCCPPAVKEKAEK